MKNEPMMTFDHVNEDNAIKRTMQKVENSGESYPISLYMLLVVDAVLISAILFITVKIIFWPYILNKGIRPG